MDNCYRLVALGNSQLVADLAVLIRQSNALTAQLLAHLVELEQRMLHLELGFSSLFSYCVEALGMSEGTAGRRVAAARVCRRFPEVFERVARGELHLCALCVLAPHLTSENAPDLFEACRGMTRRKIEELLAARFPRPDVREQIRRLPSRAQVQGSVEACPQARPTEGIPVPIPVAPRVAEIAPQPLPPAAADEVAVEGGGRRRRELEPLSVDRFGVHFTADGELRDLIERARALTSHRLPKGDLASLMKLIVSSFVRHEEKRRFGIGARPRRSNQQPRRPVAEPPLSLANGSESSEPSGGTQLNAGVARPDAGVVGMPGRYIPMAVRRGTHDRESGRCAFVSADGRHCDARAFLEFDHRIPFSKRGASDLPNIRLLCKAHNLLHARKCFGTMHIVAKIAARKRSTDAAQQLPK